MKTRNFEEKFDARVVITSVRNLSKVKCALQAQKRARPNLTLSIASPADLRAQLEAIDISVPLVTEGRTKEHREQFMMARFLG